MEILCFLTGVLFCYTHNLLVFMIMCAVLCIKPRLKLIVSFAFAVLLSTLHENLLRPQARGVDLDNQLLTVSGLISSVPISGNGKTQFYLQSPSIGRLFVSCYRNCDTLQLNQVITAQVKLRKPRNFKNPGGFDYVSFLRARHVYWLGSIKQFTLIKKYTTAHRLLNFRNNLSQHLDNFKLSPQTLGIFKALTIGISSDLHSDDWQLFRNTGTIHLLVISGAHIGFITSLVFMLVKFGWSRIGSLAIKIPSNFAASILALLIAFIYAGLAGFSVSVQRALIACGFLLSKNILTVKFSNWQAWRLAILVTLLIEPHYVLVPGFYLSFIAVAVLLIGNKFFRLKGIAKGLAMQAGCLIGLMPFTLYWFSFGSINSFVANLVAIPLVGFIIVPVCLLYLSLSWFPDFGVIAYFLTKLVGFLYFYLNFVEGSFTINLTKYLSIYALSAVLLIFVCVLIYGVRAFRVTLITLVCTLYLPKTSKISSANAKVDVLDVGQGLAVLIRTSNHTALYDTGGKFYLGKDMGEMVIAPYLQTLGINKLDKIIVSHPDLDHRGGLGTINKLYKVEQLIVNDPKFYNTGYSCHNYPAWEWDGVKFEFLAIDAQLRKRNNDSCVLLVKSPKHSILLSGDIEKEAEKYLVAKYSHNLQADFLLVPHHGSKTSSSAEFVSMVHPQVALLSYAINNRYNFPHQKAMYLYKMFNISLRSTAKYGMLSVDLISGTVH